MVDRLSKIEIILCIVIFSICQSSSHLRRRVPKPSRPVWNSGTSGINPGGLPVNSHGGYIPAPTPKPRIQTRIVSGGEGTMGGSSRRVFISASGSGASRDALMERMRKMLKEQQDRIKKQGGNGKFIITSHTSHIIEGEPQVVQGPPPEPQQNQPYQSSKPLTPSKFTPQEQATLLKYHNDVRQNLNPPPKVMEQMQWSDVLAGKAQEYAEKCEWRHSDKSGRKDQLGYRFVGENLYVSTSYGVTKSVKSWADEKAFYDYWANTCVPGQQCGHYTQMIWGTTNMVGCGIHFCKKVAFWRRGDAYYVVCNYGPGGNINGARPYEAKTDGNSNTGNSGGSVNNWRSQTIRKTVQNNWNTQTNTGNSATNGNVQNNGNIGSHWNSRNYGVPSNNWNSRNYGIPTNPANKWDNRNYGLPNNPANKKNNVNTGGQHEVHGSHNQHTRKTVITRTKGNSSKRRGSRGKMRSRRSRRR